MCAANTQLQPPIPVRKPKATCFVGQDSTPDSGCPQSYCTAEGGPRTLPARLHVTPVHECEEASTYARLLASHAAPFSAVAWPEGHIGLRSRPQPVMLCARNTFCVHQAGQQAAAACRECAELLMLPPPRMVQRAHRHPFLQRQNARVRALRGAAACGEEGRWGCACCAGRSAPSHPSPAGCARLCLHALYVQQQGERFTLVLKLGLRLLRLTRRVRRWSGGSGEAAQRSARASCITPYPWQRSGGSACARQLRSCPLAQGTLARQHAAS